MNLIETGYKFVLFLRNFVLLYDLYDYRNKRFIQKRYNIVPMYYAIFLSTYIIALY